MILPPPKIDFDAPQSVWQATVQTPAGQDENARIEMEADKKKSLNQTSTVLNVESPSIPKRIAPQFYFLNTPVSLFEFVLWLSNTFSLFHFGADGCQFSNWACDLQCANG